MTLPGQVLESELAASAVRSAAVRVLFGEGRKEDRIRCLDESV